MSGPADASTRLNSNAQSVIHRMALRCLLAVLVFCAVILAAFLVNRHQARRLSDYAAGMNYVNRQRVGISNIGQLASQLASSSERPKRKGLRNAISKELDEIESAHTAMRDVTASGGPAASPPALRRILFDPPRLLDRRFRAFVTAARVVARSDGDEGVRQAQAEIVATMASNSALADGLAAVAESYDEESLAQQKYLQITQTTFLAVSMLLIIVTGVGVFWPMIRYAITETDNLETTNAALDQRAVELAATLKQLELERDARRSRMQEMSEVMEDLEEERGKLEREIQARQLVQDALEASEQRFFAIFELAPTAMVMIDPRGVIVLANDRTEELFGYKREDLLGNPIELLVPERYRDVHPDYRAEYYARPAARRMGKGRDLFGLRKDGSEFPIEIVLSPIDAEEGLFVLSAVVDITERKRHEWTLRQSEERVRSIVNSALDAVVTMDEEGKITGWNPQAEIVFEWTAAEVIGRPMAELIVPPDFRGSYRNGLKKFLVTGDGPVLNRRVELSALRKNGDRFPVEISISPLRVGERYEFSAFVRDITARRNAEQEIKRINKELRRKNDEMQQFVYTVSHDLKSPLVTCRGFVGLMKEDAAEGKWDDVLDSIARIERATQRMADLIEDLLQLSRIGVIRNEPEWVDVGQMVNAIAEDFADRLRQASARLAVQPDLPPVLADRVRLAEVFENLLSNAIKYGCRNGDGKIDIGGVEVTGEVRYFVRDNGPGIAKEFHGKVFGLFQRLESSQEGTGVGLAAVARILEIHGGRVWIESEPGQGATFWLAFPADVDEKVNQIDTEPTTVPVPPPIGNYTAGG